MDEALQKVWDGLMWVGEQENKAFDWVFSTEDDAAVTDEAISKDPKTKKDDSGSNRSPSKPGRGGEYKFPFKTLDDFDDVARRLEKYHGVKRETASKRLHRIKKEHGTRGGDNVVFDKTGNVYNPKTGERLGGLTEK